jgi:hypothetical protein
MMLAKVAFAASIEDFSQAAAEAERDDKTAEGHDYATKFIQSISKAFSDAMQSCYDRPIEPGSRYDVIFIVSEAGKIEHTLTGTSNAFASCIGSDLRLPASVGTPPKANWAVRVQVVHGQAKDGESDPSIATFIDNAGAPKKEASGPAADYARQAIAIEEKAVSDAVKKHPERIGKNTVKTKYKIDESGQIHDLKVVVEKPNKWLEQTVRRAVSKIKFPPVPKEVTRETGMVEIENDFVSD